MDKKLKISKSFFISVGILLFTFILSLAFISKYKVEESFQSKLVVSNDSIEEVYISANKIYKIDYDSKLILFYNENYYEYKINFIKKYQKDFILEIYPINTNTKKLIPGSEIIVSVIYSYTSIINIIFNYFK